MCSPLLVSSLIYWEEEGRQKSKPKLPVKNAIDMCDPILGCHGIVFVLSMILLFLFLSFVVSVERGGLRATAEALLYESEFEVEVRTQQRTRVGNKQSFMVRRTSNKHHWSTYLPTDLPPLLPYSPGYEPSSMCIGGRFQHDCKSSGILVQWNNLQVTSILAVETYLNVITEISHKKALVVVAAMIEMASSVSRVSRAEADHISNDWKWYEMHS